MYVHQSPPPSPPNRVRRFISSIEIPGVTRPHPWVSSLHLSCRFGQAAITCMLLKRGAVPNGAGAAAFAPKSPLEVSECMVCRRQLLLLAICCWLSLEAWLHNIELKLWLHCLPVQFMLQYPP